MEIIKYLLWVVITIHVIRGISIVKNMGCNYNIDYYLDYLKGVKGIVMCFVIIAVCASLNIIFF